MGVVRCVYGMGLWAWLDCVYGIGLWAWLDVYKGWVRDVFIGVVRRV